MAETGTTDAKSNKKREQVTFYLYSQNDELVTRPKFISSPFNVITRGRDKSEDGYRDEKRIVFEGGVYTTDDKEEIEFLDAWNRGARLSNDKKYIGDGIHRIKREKPNNKVVETIVKETVEVQVIPQVILEAMTVDQIKTLCKTWSVELPKEFASGEVKDELITLLKDSGHVQN